MTRVLEFLKTRSNNQLYTVIFACFAVYHPLNTILVACGIDIAKDSAVNQGTGMKSLGFSDTIFIFLKLFAQS
jgi:hypothetical protein